MNQIKPLKLVLSWPKKLLTTRVRLAFGLALTVLSLIFVSQLLGLLPDRNQSIMAARKLQTETLAMTSSAIAESGLNLKTFRKTLKNTKNRVDDVLSIGLRDPAGELIVAVGDHSNLWTQPQDGKSNDRFMFVSVYNGKEKVAQLEICFTRLNGVQSILTSPAFQLGGFLFVCCCGAFYLLLKRTLQQLDPRGAVPKRVRDAFDNMAEGLLIMDRKCQIMMANAKFGALVGLDADRLSGMSVADFPWQSDSELPWSRAVREQKVITERSLRIVAADQGLRTFSVSAAPVLGHTGTSRGVMVTFDDVTELEVHKRELIKARNAADAANEAKSSFLARMSHEIRTPMNAIIGYTDILRQGSVKPDEQVRYLTTIQSNGDHLLELINDVLDLSKIEAGQMTIERRDVQFVTLCMQVLDTLKVKTDEKDLYLRLEVETPVPAIIETDETRLRQILINTIGNAIKFTSNGGIKLIARLVNHNGKQLLEFDIADTGIGMPDSALKNIFQPFTQADSSVTRKFGGTGLGLAICKQLSESLGGGIRARSTEGKGTVFTVTIDPGPIAEDVTLVTQATLKNHDVVHSLKPTRNRRIDGGGHVLIVDDTKANRDLASLMLSKIGLTFDVAENGKEALEQLAKRPYDVVLMDVNMPVMDGLTATRHLRKAGLKTPVIAVTAMALDSEKAKCIDSGCDSFLLKPIRRESLINVLAEFFDVIEEVVEPMATAETTRVKQVRLSEGSTISTASAEIAPSFAASPTRIAKSETKGIEEPVKQGQPMDAQGESIEDLLTDILGDSVATTDRAPTASSAGDGKLPDVVTTSLPHEPEFLAIVSDFVDRLHSRLPEFEQALAIGNTKQLSDLGHWLVGASATVGLDVLTDPGRQLEYSDGSDPEKQADLIEQIKTLSTRIQIPVVS